MNKSKIATARISLDIIREEDFDALISIFKDKTVSKTYMVPDMQSDDEEKRLFASLLNLSIRSDRYVYGIFLGNQFKSTALVITPKFIICRRLCGRPFHVFC